MKKVQTCNLLDTDMRFLPLRMPNLLLVNGPEASYQKFMSLYQIYQMLGGFYIIEIEISMGYG